MVFITLDSTGLNGPCQLKNLPISRNLSKIPVALCKPAQAALSNYLHSTRGLRFLDADRISGNSPFFLEKLVKRIDVEGDVAPLVSRFLRYHPKNEFEPFFESMGLKPSDMLHSSARHYVLER
ncbi:hypothetical protein BT93_G2304 [Corymbia citriodora subsp. variegata]|nr:hypothetical protein BT93_G2304 [Corymbia citriodora subsp. variegata]